MQSKAKVIFSSVIMVVLLLSVGGVSAERNLTAQAMLMASANIITTVDSNGDVGGGLNSIALGADDLPVISYYDATNADLKVLHCGNAVCSGGNISTTVDSAGDVGKITSLALGGDGLPVVSYYDVTNRDLKVLHCGDAFCSSGNISTTVDSTGDVGEGTSLAIGGDGLPVVSYYNSSTGDLKVLHCGDAACSSGNTVTAVDSAGDVGWNSSITLGGDGLPVVSYQDVDNRDLKVLHCGNAACSSGNISTTIDSVGNVGYYSSIITGTDGLPVIGYFDYTSYDLKVLHCGNATCSSGNTATTVDSVGDVGGSPSLALGADGLPVISYYDYSRYDLKVLHCGNATCSSDNTITTVDSRGTVGWNSAITLGADGLPVISYYDTTNTDLKVLHGSDAACSVTALYVYLPLIRK